MSASLNKAILMGKICEKGIKPFQTKTGKNGVFINLATWKKVKDEYKTSFFSIVFYSATADTLIKYAKEGTEIYVEGEINSNDEKWSITGHEFQFISAKDK